MPDPPKPPAHERYTLVAIDGAPDDVVAEVRRGLLSREKTLPCRYLYDREGSLLFECICELPEYYLTRTERGILGDVARDLARDMLAPKVALVELGSGSASKTRILIEALTARQGALRFTPIDISATVLEESSIALLEEYRELEIAAVAGEYHAGLSLLGRGDALPRLILWLGSNIGNFERPEAIRFLRRLRAAMSDRDRMLCGIDLRKDKETLEAAYDDAAGVTARFSKNLLARINRELGGRFDLGLFRHRAAWVEGPGRVEIHLESARAQVVRVDALDLTVSFEAGERIHTESSYKYSPREIDDLAGEAGLRTARRWVDAEARFSVNLFAPA